MLLAAVSLLACLGDNAWAYVGPITGTVATLEVVGSGGGAPGNGDFRFYLAGNTIICNGQTWAYINTTDVNYAALVSSLILAKSLGSTVSIYVNQDSNGYCQLAIIGAIN